MITSWTAAAEQLAEVAREHGFTCAACVASARRARVDLDATRSLIQAAYALTSGDASRHLWDQVPACPSAADFLATAEELEGETAALARHARDMAAACESARDDAIAEYEKATQEARRAQAVMGAATDPGAKAAAEAAWRAALERAEQMARVIADCDAALELIADVRERLNYAMACTRHVPVDLEDTYEPVVQFVRDGGTLPWSGNFLTGMNPVYSAGTTANGNG